MYCFAKKKSVSGLFWAQILCSTFYLFQILQPRKLFHWPGTPQELFYFEQLHHPLSSLLLPCWVSAGWAGSWSWLGKSGSILPQREAIRGWLFCENLLLKNVFTRLKMCYLRFCAIWQTDLIVKTAGEWVSKDFVLSAFNIIFSIYFLIYFSKWNTVIYVTVFQM